MASAAATEGEGNIYKTTQGDLWLGLQALFVTSATSQQWNPITWPHPNHKGGWKVLGNVIFCVPGREKEIDESFPQASISWSYCIRFSSNYDLHLTLFRLAPCLLLYLMTSTWSILFSQQQYELSGQVL